MDLVKLNAIQVGVTCPHEQQHRHLCHVFGESNQHFMNRYNKLSSRWLFVDQAPSVKAKLSSGTNMGLLVGERDIVWYVRANSPYPLM